MYWFTSTPEYDPEEEVVNEMLNPLSLDIEIV